MRCESCMEFLVVCPCCNVGFCPGCGQTEDEIEQGEEE